MADEADPGCNSSLQRNPKFELAEVKPYPTNTYDVPSHVPGKKSGVPWLDSYSPQGQPEHMKFDIVKAAQYGVLERCQQLVEEEGVDVRIPDSENVTVLHWAAINNRLQVVEYFVSKGAIVDQRGGTLNATPLHWAIRQGHLDTVVYLIKCGADPTLQDLEGCTGLHLAAQFGHSAIVAYLLAKGMDVDFIDGNGMTPLMWATYRSFGVDPSRLIINFGASINVSDSIHKNTALHWAIASSNTNAIRPLLKAGASLDSRNEQGLTPLDLAMERRNNWIIAQLQRASYERGQGKPNFMRWLSSNKDVQRRVITCLPTFSFIVLGLILEFSPWWVLSVIATATLFSLTNAIFRVFFDPDHNTIALGIYIGTKCYMFLTLFIYFWPYVATFKILTVFTLNSTLLFYCFLKCWLNDPGVIKATPSQQKQTIIELAEAGLLQDFSKFCSTCLVRRPVRSKHCSICNRCIARMDHHCPWIDNCVGYKNHHLFIGYLFALFGMNMWYIWAASVYFNSNCEPFDKGLIDAMAKVSRCAPWVTFGFAHALFHGLWVSALLVCQCYQVLWLGMTTNERLNLARYKHFHNTSTGKVVSPFGTTLLQNIADFFGISICGFIRPHRVDWMNQFDVGRFTASAETRKRFEI